MRSTDSASGGDWGRVLNFGLAEAFVDDDALTRTRAAGAGVTLRAVLLVAAGLPSVAFWLATVLLMVTDLLLELSRFFTGRGRLRTVEPESRALPVGVVLFTGEGVKVTARATTESAVISLKRLLGWDSALVSVGVDSGAFSPKSTEETWLWLTSGVLPLRGLFFPNFRGGVGLISSRDEKAAATGGAGCLTSHVEINVPLSECPAVDEMGVVTSSSSRVRVVGSFVRVRVSVTRADGACLSLTLGSCALCCWATAKARTLSAKVALLPLPRAAL